MPELSASRKKLLKIVGVIIAVIVVALGALTTVALTTDRGKEVVDTVAQPFRPVKLPDSSLDLTKVPEAQVNRPDSSDDKHINVDMEGREIADEPPAPAAPAPGSGSRNPSPNSSDPDRPHRFPSAEEMNQVSNTGIRFEAPAVGLNVPYGMIDEVEGVIRPTNFTSAFGVRNRGVPFNQTHRGTAYVALHALDSNDRGELNGIAPGNFLIDTATRQPRLANGQEIKIGGERFIVESSKRLGKGLISRDREVWDASIKNRVIVITCFPSSNDNQIFVARKA